MAIILFISLASKTVNTSTFFLLCVVALILFRHDLFLPNSAVIFCHPNIICLICLSLLNIYFYTIRSLTMFLKVLNKLNLKKEEKNKTKTKAKKLLELLAINLSSSKRRTIFVLQLLKFSHGLVVF